MGNFAQEKRNSGPLMQRSSWALLAEIEERLSDCGQERLLPLVVKLICATHNEALSSHEVLQAEDARNGKKTKDAERHAIFDAAIICAAGNVPLAPTRKMAESLEAVVHAKLLEADYAGKPPSWATIKRRIAKILDGQSQA